MRLSKLLTALAVATVITSGVMAQIRVYVMSSGDAATDNAVLGALTAGGHSPTLGVQYTEFDGSIDLSNYDVVYIQANYNWSAGTMPAEGQTYLVNWLSGGRGIVTCEWVLYLSSYAFSSLASQIFPASYNSYRTTSTATFTRSVEDPILDSGVHATFTFPVDNYAGTESRITPKTGATAFYMSDFAPDGAGLVGWQLANGGRVIQFSTTNGPSQLADPNFRQLFNNAFRWVVRGRPRPQGDVNGDGCVDDADLLIVLFNFGSGCDD